MTAIPTLTLDDGRAIPQVGYGTFQVSVREAGLREGHPRG